MRNEQAVPNSLLGKRNWLRFEKAELVKGKADLEEQLENFKNTKAKVPWGKTARKRLVRNNRHYKRRIAKYKKVLEEFKVSKGDD